MPIATQAKLLRALQNQEIQRVGSLQSAQSQRACHRGDRTETCARPLPTGFFREDLYYRLAMVEIPVPSLAETQRRPSAADAPFCREVFPSSTAKTIRGVSPRARLVLERHSWPGNVRELENAIGHASMMAESDEIDVGDLPASLLGDPLDTTANGSTGPPPGQPSTMGEDASLAEHERQLVVSALRKGAGKTSLMRRGALGIGRDALRYKMKKVRTAVDSGPDWLTPSLSRVTWWLPQPASQPSPAQSPGPAGFAR